MGFTGDRESVPEGVVTFLFTDVEGSSRVWEQDSAAAAESIEIHDDLVRRVVNEAGGFLFGWAGDHFRVAFEDPQAAVDAAVAIQEGLAGADWRDCPRLAVRIALHRGPALQRGGDYFGTVPNRTSRLEDCAVGGQILLSSDVAEMVTQEMLFLGHHYLRDLSEPILIYQVGTDEFPAIRRFGR
ncbi:MAG: adenylate/guanylate cyclase domain-containing protein [Acidimicrobiaceae bacterium]|nr:adenylate/guanylate cyclase domain-containing protein [Acidimicrobiia bacterium]MCY4492641.1 adenylate/guanylate cyclase domain-containing protein [Acidimicrobiaceae bacterium]